jgi:hypothetical protein
MKMAKRIMLSLVLISCVLCAGWRLVPYLAKRVEQRRITKTALEIRKLASEIERSGQQSRLPRNEAELVQRLHKPIPRSAWNTRLDYKLLPQNSDHFRISTTSLFPGWLMFEYNSATPEKGVVVNSF